MVQSRSERNSEKTGHRDRPDALPAFILISKLKTLAEAIHELEAEVKVREALSKCFLDAIRREIEHVRDLLSRLGEPWSRGYLPAFEELRTKLVSELFNLASRERSERLRAWENIAALKKQRRAFLMEYQALKKTSELLEEPEGGERG
jgi:hypothetical protein